MFPWIQPEPQVHATPKTSIKSEPITGVPADTAKELGDGILWIGNNAEKLPNQGIVKGNVVGAPSIDAGKQGKHVPGHNNNNSTKSQWPQGENGVDLTQEAWQKGTVVKPDGTVKIYDLGKTIGTNGETRVKVHIDSNGNLHGYPVQ